jgi:hypothetical protein
MGLFDRITGGLDRLTGHALPKTLINRWLDGIATVSELRIDRAAHRIDLVLHLAGDEQPVRGRIGRYRIEDDGDGSAIIVDDLWADRPWLNETLRRFVAGRRFHADVRRTVLEQVL